VVVAGIDQQQCQVVLGYHFELEGTGDFAAGWADDQLNQRDCWQC